MSVSTREQELQALADDVPAFPVVVPDTNCSVISGMTLRDYFAATAIHGCVDLGGGGNIKWMAERAYAIADAMLAEKAKS